MLARYTMHRGRRPADDPLPHGIRQDTRKHTRHILRPSAEAVVAYLADPSPKAWRKFSESYRQNLEDHFRNNREAFDQLAERARERDVYLGCSCPTRKNPDVRHCHTFLALQFMKTHFPDLEVRLPE